MEIEGNVVSGFGVAKIWVSKIKNVFFERTGKELFPGTLNIKLNHEYKFEPDMIIHKEEYAGNYDVYIKKCKILEETAYIVRSGKNLKEDGDYKLNIVEIMSEINLRNKYNLKDGQSVKILECE